MSNKLSTEAIRWCAACLETDVDALLELRKVVRENPPEALKSHRARDVLERRGLKPESADTRAFDRTCLAVVRALRGIAEAADPGGAEPDPDEARYRVVTMCLTCFDTGKELVDHDGRSGYRPCPRGCEPTK